MLGAGLILSLLLSAPPEDDEGRDVRRGKDSDCIRYDDKDQPFQTCFDPGNGLELSATALHRASSGGSNLTTDLSAGILLRTERESLSKRGTRWFNTHRILMTHVQPVVTVRHLESTLYRGVYRRHLAEGFILIPTARPIRLPFPFDIAVSVDVGRYERRVYEGRGFSLDTARAAVLLDPLRSATGRVRLAFGPALGHSLRTDGVDWSQEISPLTTGMVDLGLETDDGWWNIRGRGYLGQMFNPLGGSALRGRAELTIDRLLLAVNDAPVSLSLRATGALAEAGVARRDEWTVGVGLSTRALGN